MKQAVIAVLVSGGGTNLQALIDAQQSGLLSSGRIGLVVSNNPNAFALQRAERAGIPTREQTERFLKDGVLINEEELDARAKHYEDLVV